MKKFWLMFFVAAGALTLCGESFHAQFLPGKWDAGDFEIVKSSRTAHIGKFIQKDDCIVNEVPAGKTPEELQRDVRHTFSSMLYKKSFSGNVTISATMAFDSRMAPGIIVASEPLRGGCAVPELAEHFEIILYDNGLNVWHHFFVNDRQKWTKAAYYFEEKVFKPRTFYTVTVKISSASGLRQIEVYCNGKMVGSRALKYFPTFRVGIVGSEGINYFRDVTITDR